MSDVPPDYLSLNKLQEILTSAFALYDSDRLAEAEATCRQVLAIDPSQPAAIHLLGLLYSKTGRHAEAVEQIVRSISIRPQDPDYRRNLAAALRLAGRSSEAIDAYRAALALRADLSVLLDLCNALHENGQHREAESYARQAIASHPNSPAAHLALGSILVSMQRLDEGIAQFQIAMSLDSTSAEAYKRMGTAMYHRGRFKKAFDFLELSDRLRPSDPQVINQLGMTLEKLGRHAEAVSWFNRILTFECRTAEDYFYRANALESLERFEESVELYQKALAMKPNIWRGGLATALDKLGWSDESLEVSKQALDGYPEYPLGHLNYAMSLLLKGRYEEGWKEYDWRWHCPTQHEDPRVYPQPLWRTQSPQGKRILLYAEQGLGDTILTARYAPLVKQKGATRVILECQGQLLNLFRESLPEIEVIRSGDPLPDFDLHAGMFDMPLVFGTTLETIPQNVPYLHAEPQKVDAWRKRIGDEKFKVGLVWAGGASNPGDRYRSMPLNAMAPLASVDLERVRFFSLQLGPPSAQAADPPEGIRLEDYTQHVNKFDDTAAFISCLDLVIAVDTSTAHLAGALGKPVWVPLPFAWFWLYLEKREDTPWYPTMRLFRQSRRGDWSEPMARIADALKTRLAER